MVLPPLKDFDEDKPMAKPPTLTTTAGNPIGDNQKS
jgi:hypothetical protein